VTLSVRLRWVRRMFVLDQLFLVIALTSFEGCPMSASSDLAEGLAPRAP
jgi:hypothetical protein